MRWTGGTIAAVLALSLAVPAVASDQEYTRLRKAGRGLASLTTGFLEIPAQVIASSEEHGVWLGTPTGLLLGGVQMLQRTLVGVFEVLTFPFPTPPGFEPIVEPEFAWDRFDDAIYLADEKREIEAIGGVAVERRRGALVVRFPDELLFRVDSRTLTRDARRRLNELAKVLERHPQTRIAIKGYTDSTGSEPHNLKLSQARARAVYGYLTARGVASTRLIADGFGEARPIASNDTAEGRRSNRRVELEVRAGGVAAR